MSYEVDMRFHSHNVVTSHHITYITSQFITMQHCIASVTTSHRVTVCSHLNFREEMAIMHLPALNIVRMLVLVFLVYFKRVSRMPVKSIEGDIVNFFT